jgi:hypothetical protein
VASASRRCRPRRSGLSSPKLAPPERRDDFLVMKAILDWHLEE